MSEIELQNVKNKVVVTLSDSAFKIIRDLAGGSRSNMSLTCQNLIEASLQTLLDNGILKKIKEDFNQEKGETEDENEIN